jgi:hypothetical protein
MPENQNEAGCHWEPSRSKKINPEVHKKDSFFRKSERPCTSVVMDQSVSWDRRKKRLRLLVFLAFELV